MQILVQLFKEMSPARLIAMLVSVIIFVMFFVLYLVKVNNSDFAVLYADLDMQDSAKIAKELDSKKIIYQSDIDGSVIKVNKKEVNNVRLLLAQSGLPSSGSIIGYEIFDKDDGIGATNFSQNIKLIRALEGELSRTITAFDEVDRARVHLVMPQREIFSKEKLEPRASIVLKFRSNKKLGKGEIDSISHLVLMAVPGLEMKNITIVDTKGRALKIGIDEEGSEFASGKNEEVRIAAENRLRQVIEGLLENSVGHGKVKARVSLNMNFDRVITNSELYDPEAAVARSIQSVDEKEQTPVGGGEGGDVSAANNLPGAAGGGAAGDSSKFAMVEKSEQTTNYEISKTIKNHISETGAITKMSIAILVDGIYKTDATTGESTYSDRPKEELDKILNLVKSAVGFDSDRNDTIEIINMRFSDSINLLEADNFEWIKDELPNIFQTLIFAIVVVLILVTVIRPIALKVFEVKGFREEDILKEGISADGSLSSAVPSAESVRAGAAAVIAGGSHSSAKDGSAASHEEIDEHSQQVAVSISKVNHIAEHNPQDLVNVLRKWLNEEN